MAAEGFRPHRSALAGWEAVSAESARAFDRHSHDAYGFGVIERGAQRSLSGRGVVEAGPGDLIMVNPGEVHDGLPLGRDGRAWHMLYVTPERMAQIGAELGMPAGSGEWLPPVARDPALAAEVLRLFRLLTAPAAAGDALQGEGRGLATLSALLQRHAGLRLQPEPPAPIARCRELIDDDPAAALSLADLAAEAGLSRFQVMRGFARELGLTPNAYRMQRRIASARGLIGRGLPLAEAAAMAGFADQSHMTRAFVRHLGYTPGAYAAACNRVQDR